MSRSLLRGPMLRRLPRFPERIYRFTALATVLMVLMLVGTGGWVRLSESGLGCPTWPRCYGNDLVAHATYHSLVEFVNRCAITAVAILIGVTIVGALLAPRRRRELLWLSAGLLAGYMAEAVLGGLTVLARLTPGLVAAHFIVAMLVLADAVVLHWSAGHGPGVQLPATRPEVRLLARLLLSVLGLVIVLGTITTGAGPDAGSPDVPRFGFRFPAVAELHAVVVMFLAGLVAAAFFALRLGAAGRAAHRAYVMLLAAIVLQSIVGYAQYFDGLPAGLIEVHIVVAGIVVIAAVRFNLVLGPPAGQAPSAPLPASPGEHRHPDAGEPGMPPASPPAGR